MGKLNFPDREYNLVLADLYYGKWKKKNKGCSKVRKMTLNRNLNLDKGIEMAEYGKFR